MLYFKFIAITTKIKYAIAGFIIRTHGIFLTVEVYKNKNKIF